MEKTTVLIPNYNGKEYLRECLLSLQAETMRNFQVMVVDNGSSDGSALMLQDEFRDVACVLLNENKGFAGGVNAGLLQVQTPYVILLNNDTKTEPGFVRNLEQAIEENEQIFSVSAKMVSMQQPDVIDDAGDLYCALGWSFALGKGKKADQCYKKNEAVFSACGGAAIYRMSLLNKTGYFDEEHFAYLEDVDLGYRARIMGYENRCEPLAVCLHAGSGYSGSRYNEFKIKLSSKNSIYLIYKNMPFLQIVLNLPFLLAGFFIKIFFFVLKGYGHTYIKGLWNGICFCTTKAARSHKIRFQLKYFTNYVRIQLQLWWNIVRRIAG